jgi:hypothetical protein
MGLVRQLFGTKEIAPQSEPELPSATAPAPTPAPASTPEPTPTSTPAPVPSSTPLPLYAVHDAAGTIVDISCWDIDAESPAVHAEEFLHWLVENKALAGECVIEKVLKRLYATVFCRQVAIRPLPWLSVLRHFNKLLRTIYGPATFKSYQPVYKRGRRRKLMAYRIPLLQEGAQAPKQQTEVVA